MQILFNVKVWMCKHYKQRIFYLEMVFLFCFTGFSNYYESIYQDDIFLQKRNN